MFSQDELAKVISDTLPKLPKDRTTAIVATVDTSGLGIVGKFDKNTKSGNWELDFAVKRDWNGGVNLGTKVIWSF